MLYLSQVVRSGNLPIMAQYIGIDIGGNKIVGGIVSDSGKVLTRKECSTPVQGGGPQILKDSIRLVADLIKSSDKPVKGIGIGAGGQIDADKGIVCSATEVLPDWQGTNIADAFAKEFGLPTAVDNDVNALALGEALFGVAASIRKGTVLFLLLDAGVGGALLSNSAIHHGANWSGGEFGQILLTMDTNARKGPGGSIGTLEAYCSVPGLIETWKELGGKGSTTVKDIIAEAKKDSQSIGAKAINKTGEYLGYGLVSLFNALNPHLIVIGGELANCGDALIESAKRVLMMRSISGTGTCAVVKANLGEEAAIIGAASLSMVKPDVLEAASASAKA